MEEVRSVRHRCGRQRACGADLCQLSDGYRHGGRLLRTDSGGTQSTYSDSGQGNHTARHEDKADIQVSGGEVVHVFNDVSLYWL